jgi:hypothetical protein
MRNPLTVAGSASPVAPAPLFVYVRSYVPPVTSRLVQQLSLAAPQFVVPAPLTWQLAGVAVHAPALQYGVAAGQATGLPHAVHPLLCVAHVSSPVTHWPAPIVHTLVQHAPALHAPLGHVVDVDS